MEKQINAQIPLLCDLEISSTIAQDIIHLLSPKSCYDNVFVTVSEFIERFDSGEWKVGYGYLHVTDRFWTRHCFIVETGTKNVIDPTMAKYSIREHLEYLPFAILELDEYLEHISANNYNPTLENLDESSISEYAAIHNLYLHK